MLKLKKVDRCLIIEKNGQTVFTVDPYKPAPLMVGKGENTYSMSHGSFKIKEKLSEQNYVKITDIANSDDSALITTNYGNIQLDIEQGSVLFKSLPLKNFLNFWSPK